MKNKNFNNYSKKSDDKTMLKVAIYSTIAVVIAVALCLLSKERYSEGEKVGNLIEFTKKGVIWDSWEGRLNMTQTGMNTSGDPFAFSLDNDRTDQDSLVTLLYQAQADGWKVKIKYHETWGPCINVFSNRGETDYFIDDVIVIDKDFANVAKRLSGARQGQVIDTVYVVIDKSELKNRKK